MDKPIRMNLQFFAEEEPIVEQVDDMPIETVDEGESTDEEFDTITYNKEEVKIPISERREYLEKGYNYDKVKGRYEELKNDPRLGFVETLAKQNNMNVEEYINAVNEAQEKQRIRELAEKQGIPEEVAQRISDLEARAKASDEEKQQQEANQKILDEFGELKQRGIERVEDIKQEVWDLRKEKGISLLDAYNRIKIEELEQSIPTIKEKAEQETIKKITNNAITPNSVGNSKVNHKSGVWDLSDAEFDKKVEQAKQGLLT